jgi:hypothetical protein
MIKYKNLGQFLLELKIAGTIGTTGIHQALAVAPFAGFITNFFATLTKTANGTYTTTVDINKNGTSILSTAMTFTGTNGTVGYGVLTSDPVSVSAGDVFSLDVDGIGNGHIGIYVAMMLDRTLPNAANTFSDLAALP